MYSIKHINFATCSRNTPNSNTNKNYKKMATTIYNVVITNENGVNWPELIDNVIYTNLDEAKNTSNLGSARASEMARNMRIVLDPHSNITTSTLTIKDSVYWKSRKSI